MSIPIEQWVNSVIDPNDIDNRSDRLFQRAQHIYQNQQPAAESTPY